MNTMRLLARAGRQFNRLSFVQSLWVLVVLGSLVLRQVSATSQGDHAENDFAEFEEFDETPDANSRSDFVDDEPSHSAGDERQQPQTQQLTEDDAMEATVEEEFDDAVFEVIDEAEFEDGASTIQKDADGDERSKKPQPLQFADVPAHLRNNWSNYQVELLLLFVLVVYLVNYVIGKQTNHNIATQWFDAHQDLLSEQFSLVGDDGSEAALQGRAQFVKETDSTIALWCSGRQGVANLLVQLKLIKRQDLLSMIAQLVRPKYDHVAIRVELEPNEMDSYVCAVGQKKAMNKLARELTDLSQYTVEKKNAVQMGLPASFTVYSEIQEATAAMLDPRVLSALQKFGDSVEYLHFSDQFSGIKPNEDTQPTKLPDVSPVIVLGYNLDRRNSADKGMENTKALLQLLFYCIEKARRYRLSREGKSKAERNRKDAQQSFLKTTHAQRAEAAAARREEKIRERKQRLMEEEDPEKQRRLEKIEQKREAKKKQPRMKQLKVKSA